MKSTPMVSTESGMERGWLKPVQPDKKSSRIDCFFEPIMKGSLNLVLAHFLKEMEDESISRATTSWVESLFSIVSA